MPNRILREGINSSPRINSLTPGAELFYRRLMSVVDDYGRFYASPATLRGACWPTCPERVCEQDVSKWIAECSHVAIKAGPLIHVYEVDGCKYLEVVDFRQQRRTGSKFPDPAINLLADCEQNASTRRSRISEAKAEARADAAPVCKPVPVRTSATSQEEKPNPEIVNVTERMYALHPKKKNLTLVPVALERATRANGFPGFSKIEACHSEWVATADWTEKNGRFCPPLDQWIDDRGWMQRPGSREPPARPLNRYKGPIEEVEGGL